MSEPTPLSAAQIEQYLAIIVRRVRQAVVELEDDDLWMLHPRSPLSEDDRRASPYQVSHSARALLGSAVDHMHAAVNLLDAARVLHPMAPFTLIRGALETSAAAVWMLSPASRTERITRRFRWAVTDAEDSYAATDELGVERNRPRTAQLDAIRAAAASAGGIDERAVTRAGSTSILKAAELALPDPLHLVTAWRICSGFAHGRTWASLGMLNREEVSRDPAGGFVLLRLTSDHSRLAWALGIALDTTTHAATLYQRRASAP